MEQSKRENLEIKKEKIEKLFENYRISGLGLMTTVIGLSSGAFIGLFQYEKTKELSFFYFIPIAIALIQQLTHYIGSHKKATYKYYQLIASHTNNPDRGMDSQVNAMENLETAKLYFKLSDVFCWLACLSLGIATIYPLILLSSIGISIIILIIVLSCLVYWFTKWIKLKRRLERTDYFEQL